MNDQTVSQILLAFLARWNCPKCDFGLSIYSYCMAQCWECGQKIVVKRVQTEKDHAGVNLPAHEFNNWTSDMIVVILDGGVWRYSYKKDISVGPLIPGKNGWPDYYIAQADNFKRMGR